MKRVDLSTRSRQPNSIRPVTKKLMEWVSMQIEKKVLTDCFNGGCIGFGLLFPCEAD